MPIDQFFREFNALEFRKLCIPFFTPIEGQTNLSGPRKDGFILDRGFVIEMIRIGETVAFHNAQVLAREISDPVEPRLAVQSGDLDN